MIEIRVPPSKSLTQRAILVAALAGGRSVIEDPLRCDDSEALLRGLAELGVSATWRDTAIEVEGADLLHPTGRVLQLGNAGTAVRFLTAACLLADRPYRIDGVEAMRRRPMKGLLEALGALGAEWDTPQKSHCPPVDLSPPAEPGTGWRHTPSVELDPTESSQQLSALLMVGCRLGAGLDLEVCGPVPSAPYVDLTLEVMNRFGGQAQRTDRGFVTSPSGYRATRYRVEGDCSSASYVWAAGALTGRAVRVCNVRPDSLQGDQVFPELLDQLERDGPCTLDLGSTPDIAPTVATCALFREHLTTITNVSHLRVKECDRLAVLAAELRKMGASIEETDDGWRIEPASLSGPAVCDPRGDHRMAMCFGLASLRVDGIQINDPDCVSKSYPGYWDMLEVFK